MSNRFSSVLWVAYLCLGLPAAAGTLTGVVRNGTSGAPAAGQDVVLIALQGGMEAVATTKTDTQGRYSFDRPEIGQAPLLVRVVYQGVNYHQNVPPGRTAADIEIFEPTATVKDLQITSRVLFIQPNGLELLVGEEYTVHNHARPPASFNREFEFRIPEAAQLHQVSAWGPAGMPVVQGTITKGKGHYALAFPMRPGQNGVRISYQLPYVANQAAVGAPSPYPVDSLMVIAPPTMQVAGAGFRPAGNEQGWNVFARNAVAAGASLEVAVSGTAPPPRQDPGPTSQSAGAESGARIQTLPGRLENLQWVLIGGFAALFALGAVLLWRKPRQGQQVAAAPAQGNRKGPQSLEAGVAHELAQVVASELAKMKDTLFRLELRRQAGTISEQEYAAERARIEKVLGDLVRGPDTSGRR